MHLKELTLRGFKSFASATKFRFEPGITCIVGPNGSGKSNVVDALAWVMGEQGAKSLRGGNMADVIFAGSSDRTALGRAQVELTIDNSDGNLPISYSEVTISRTMFRSGGSEYAINRQPVRLLDVQELLSDTGMGRQMHAIVGQGQLDAVLTATPQDRRAFIDEAAGVAKHRRRKERALRKLESMDSNLVRVLDLTDEIRKQLRPLARQAKAAREAAGVRERLEYAKARLLAADTIQSHDRLIMEWEQLEVLRRNSENSELQIELSRQELAELQQDSMLLGRQLDQVQERFRDFREVAQKLTYIAELASERATGANRVPAAVSEEAVELSAKRAEEAVRDAQRAQDEAEAARSASLDAEQKRFASQEATERARQYLRTKQSEYDRLTQQFQDHERRRERADTAQANAKEQLVLAERRLADAKSRLSGLPQVPEEEGAVGLGVDALNTDGVGTGSAQHHYQVAVDAEDAARRALDDAERRVRSAAENLSRQASRRDTLAASLGAMHPRGSSSTAEYSVSTLESSLQDYIKVDRGWEDAVAVLLGAMTTAKVLVEETSGLSSAARALQDLRGSKPSKASASVVGYVTQGGVSSDRRMSPIYGALPASSVVDADSIVAAAVTELLEGCWVVESAELADQLFATVPDARCAATKGGLIFTPHSVRMAAGDGPSALKLRSELEDAQASTETARASLKEAEAAGVRVRAALGVASTTRNEALQRLRKNDAERAAVAQERARLAALHHAARQDVERAQYEVVRQQANLEQAQQAVAAVVASAPAEELEPTDKVLYPLRLVLSECEQTLEADREQESAERMAAHVAGERAASMERQAKAFLAQAQQLREDRIRQMERETKAKSVVLRAEEVVNRAREGSRRAEKLALRSQEAREEVAAVKAKIDSRQQGLQAKLMMLEQSRSGDREQLLQAEVAFAQSQSTYRALLDEAEEIIGLSKSLDDVEEPVFDRSGEDQVVDESNDDSSNIVFELSAQVREFLREFGPTEPWAITEEGEEIPFSRQIAQEAARKAERELQRLGVVNPLAVEEHAALRSRHDFLMEQIEDLNRSKADLLALIREVDIQVKTAFNSAFDDTASRFSEVFERLFPGGTGRLELTDPEDPLTTGVEIFARPSGKKVTRLSLLSGGERSLAALAYLIAIFLARPSPFYVMDEVEAALDDSNLSRILRLFEDLRSESQLLIITHQKRTMEIADALYGVSMKRGVTAVVSHRMDEVAS